MNFPRSRIFFFELERGILVEVEKRNSMNKSAFVSKAIFFIRLSTAENKYVVNKNVGIDIVILDHDVNVKIYFWKRQDISERREKVWRVEDRCGRMSHGDRRESGSLEGKERLKVEGGRLICETHVTNCVIIPHMVQLSTLTR